MKFLAWLIGAPLAIVAVAFSIANRDLARLDLWPLPFSVDLPVYVTVLGSMVAGSLLGWVAAWLSSGRLRARLRERNARILELEREAMLAQSRTPVPPSEQLPSSSA